MKKTRVIFFDTETNGTARSSSVLSISAIKAVFSGNDIETIEDRFTRYYYRKPWERENPAAIGVNGLTEEVIRQRRGDAEYAPCFHEDIHNFRAFCFRVTHFVGHNIAFDRRFLNFRLRHTFCTMRENAAIINLKKCDGNLKWPRLSEAASFYQIDLNDDELHASDYDTLLTYEVFKKMLSRDTTRERVLQFLTVR
jgi:DNA polymerase-3 subunit epsilon